MHGKLLIIRSPQLKETNPVRSESNKVKRRFLKINLLMFTTVYRYTSKSVKML